MKVYYLNGGGAPEVWEAKISDGEFDRQLKRGEVATANITISRDGQVKNVKLDEIWSPQILRQSADQGP